MDIYKAYNYSTQVLAASLRHPLHVVAAARMGAHIGTMPLESIRTAFKHPLTDRGLEGFLKDWEKARETLGDVFEPASARNPRREPIGNRLAGHHRSLGAGHRCSGCDSASSLSKTRGS